ncbi:hypothetical protein [Endozoicomonas elysicola]|uniref:Uncharacterized protein n=1 Tax=Endozoicomonas elysicola TaxID=305900 RepID=A0A081K7J9_9GAMM|nr:hypothetical protein [Endozoicomonas elysicola]KEI70125.1 hypothetical protein GV64_04615 [Endozoicomonas elysicola]
MFTGERNYDYILNIKVNNMIKDCCSWVSGLWGSSSSTTTEVPASQKISERTPFIQRDGNQGVFSPPRPIKSIRDYGIAHSNPAITFSHIEASAGKVCQLVRMTGNTILKISSYPSRATFPILEDLLSSGIKGQGLPTLAAVCEDREAFIKNSMSPKNFRVEAGETAYYYLQLLLYLNAREAPHIRDLAPYPYVKDTLVKYWDCLFKPMSVAAEAKVMCELELGSYDKPEFNNNDGGERMREEESKLNQLAVNLKKLVLSSGGSRAERDISNNQCLIDLLLDVLALHSGGRSDRVVKSLPPEIINFLDKKLGYRTFVSESCSRETRSLLHPANLGLD